MTIPRNLTAWFEALLLLLLATISSVAQDDVSVAGAYRDEQIVIRLVRAENRTGYTGTVELGDRKYPLRAEQEEQRLKGFFESDGDDFPFSATVVGRILVFTTDGVTYRLKKQTTNPLARSPSKPNPLAQARTNAPATVPPTEVALPAKANLLRLRRHSIPDDPGMIGGEASSLLAPSDWQVEGGVTWRMHASLPAYVALRASNSNRTEVLEAFPSIPFVWVEGGIPMFPVGANYMGNEVGQPIEDPVTYIQHVVLPRFRSNLKSPQLVSTEELPRVAEVIGETAREPAAQQRFRAARIRLEYTESGRPMQEDIYCVMGLTTVLATRTTFWGADRNYSFKAEKGRLDARAKLFHAIVSSFRSNPQWVNRYVQVLQFMTQLPFDSTRSPAELARFVPRTTEVISDLRRRIYERQQADQDRVNASFNEYVRGLVEYRNPFESRVVRLPAGYAVAWVSPTGEYLLSDEPAFNPNGSTRRDWQNMEKEH
jgi:hypothetical protein